MELSTVRNRERLKARREPYWQKLGTGRYLGVRIFESGKGSSWIARYYDPDTHPDRPAKSLGDFSTLPPSERYGAAKKAAEEWFEHLAGGGSSTVLTVKQACERYATALAKESEAKAKEVRRRFEQYVYGDPVAKVKLQKITKRQVLDWRQRLEDLPAKVTRTKKGRIVTKARAKATINRDIVPFRAALNMALEHGEVLTALAWQSALKPYEATGGRRDLYLDRGQRRTLIEALPPDSAAFVRGLCSLPLRPGALAALTVADFDARRSQLTIGYDKAGAARRILLPAATVALFKEQTRSKLPGARIFTRADSAPWTKNDWNDAIRDVAESVSLPAGTTTYALRHSTITDLVTGGLDLLTVAQVSGTSIEMIEDHYGHLRQEHAARALEKLAL